MLKRRILIVFTKPDNKGNDHGQYQIELGANKGKVAAPPLVLWIQKVIQLIHHKYQDGAMTKRHKKAC